MAGDLHLRIRHLLALARSSNPHEAATAVAIAQQLADRHAVDLGVLASGEGDDARLDDTPLDTVSPDWHVDLAIVLAEANGCLVVDDGLHSYLAGVPADLAVVRELYAWLAGELRRLGGTRASADFFFGAITAVEHRLAASPSTGDEATLARARERRRVCARAVASASTGEEAVAPPAVAADTRAWMEGAVAGHRLDLHRPRRRLRS